jgi:hypothetical protein
MENYEDHTVTTNDEIDRKSKVARQMRNPDKSGGQQPGAAMMAKLFEEVLP